MLDTTRIEVDMRQGHQTLCRRGRMPARVLSLPFSWVIGLLVVIGVWTSPEAWAVTANPTSLTFQGIQGGPNPASQTVYLTKSGYRQRTWTATEYRSWLAVSAGSGTITRSTTFAVRVNITGLAAGTYSGRVTITLDNGESAYVSVTLKVASAPVSPPPPPPPASPPPPPPTSSTQALLTWSAVIDSKLAGYKVYVGTRSGVYGTPVDVGNVTSYTVSNLLVGTTYYFVVTSYSSSGSESPYSNEVSKSVY